MATRFSVVIEGVEYPVEVSDRQVTVAERTYQAKVRVAGPVFKVWLGRKSFEFRVQGRTVTLGGEPLEVIFEGYENHDGEGPGRPRARAPLGEGIVRAPMPGRVVAVAVKEGEPVSLGSPLLILEAMKMQNEIPSPAGGVVKEVKVAPDDVVGKEEILVVIQ